MCLLNSNITLGGVVRLAVSSVPLLLVFVQVTALLNAASMPPACFIPAIYGTDPLAVGVGAANQPALPGEVKHKAAPSLSPSTHAPCINTTGNGHDAATGKCSNGEKK